ncbi:MAG TPA: 5-methyltetrahydropteroyltriglutamate--homocysteine S-methyltransferase [Alphaproteobacteria bacterium]|jgi:5-methyltetrahydropteroyltriglutamate--homocysteine methyltransferase
MTVQTRLKPPFRAEHIGSFLRPQRLIEAARAHKAGTLDDAGFAKVQDDCVREIVAFQEDLGLRSITDGEFRRRGWSAGFIDSVEGFGLRDGTLGFRTETQIVGVASSPYAKSKLKRKHRIIADDYKFLKTAVRKGTPKVTVASPPVMHYFLGPKAYETSVYKDREAFFADLVKIYQDEVADLAKEGCTYLQLDDTAMPCNCDDKARHDVVARGEDPDELTRTYAKLINSAIAQKPANMTVGMHLCRGNLKGAWMAEGGYDPIADVLFNQVNVDGYFLEYDTARAGDFKPLRFVPKGKTVILGLVSTKTPVLEKKDELKRRIEDAAKYCPLEQLGLSPQCGFSSGGGSGQVMTEDATKQKLALIVEVAREVWGSA